MLVVIGIILLLAGMLFIGGRYIFGSSRKNATKTTLGNAANMLAEYDAKTRKISDLDILYTNAAPPANPLAAPGRVDRDAYPDLSTDRYESDAVELTQQVMTSLRAMPLNRSAIEQLPAEQLLQGPGEFDDYTSITLIMPSGISGSDPIVFDPPMLADAWGNPIIFVPSQGLMDVTFADKDADQYRVTSQGVALEAAAVPAGVRPFFASAGEDGNFQTGDDNIYSFEN
jgi:hypothetical protein